MIVSLISSRSTRGGRLGASIAAAVWLALAPAAPAGAQTLTRGTAPECLLLAQSGHRDTLNQCPFLGVKRTSTQRRFRLSSR
jgi:hypothetical protein